MLNSKELNLLYHLLDQKDHQSLSDIAKALEVSERSIRYYISNINTHFSKPLISLQKGLCWIENKKQVHQFLANEDIVIVSGDLQKLFIRYSLLFFEHINLTSISKALQLSRTSIKLYFDQVKSEFPLKFNFDYAHKQGIILRYDEVELRKLQLQALNDFYGFDPYKQKSLQPYLNHYNDPKVSDLIDTYLSTVHKDLNTLLFDQAYQLIKLYLLIMIKRVQLNKKIQPVHHFSFMSECKEYILLKKHLPLLEESLSIHIDNNELLALCDVFIGSHYSNDQENNWFEYELLVSKLINMFSEIYKMNLHQDTLLYQSLLTHLKPTLYRLQNGINVQEIDADAIYKQFTKEYETTRIVLNRLHFFTNVSEDHEEIALLTLHFKAAIDRLQHRFAKRANVLLVCSHGYGTSQLLKQQLLDTYEVHILDCIPAHFLNNYNQFEHVDFIITTIPNLSLSQPLTILQVSPVLNDEDHKNLSPLLFPKQKSQIFLSQLMDIIKTHCFIKDESELGKALTSSFSNQLINDINQHSSSLLHILPLQNIAFKPKVDTWEEAIQLGGKLLEENGACTSKYVEKLLSSFENYGDYMIIAEGVAIPHAKTDDDVKQTGMSLLILENPVVFHQDKKLSIIFSFCSKDNHEHIDALVAIANLIKESNFINEIHSFKSALDVLRYIIDFTSH